jgi:DNA-directed RNA polymerase subunit RPC12/RpoP
MEETATFISHLSINWGTNDSPVDKGQQEFKCTQCGATFSTIDIRPHPYSASFPSRCPHCQSIRTLPASEEKLARRYERIWQMMELAEKERKEDKKEVIFEKFVANWW